MNTQNGAQKIEDCIPSQLELGYELGYDLKFWMHIEWKTKENDRLTLYSVLLI